MICFVCIIAILLLATGVGMSLMYNAAAGVLLAALGAFLLFHFIGKEEKSLCKCTHRKVDSDEC